MDWKNLLRLWTYASEPDPYSRRAKSKEIEGAGLTVPDVVPDIRQDGSFWGGSRKTVLRLRDTSDFIDLSTTTNRQSRYKEYERLRNTAEVEAAMTVYANETCVSGDTKVATPFGYWSIKELAETKPADERFLVYCFDFGKRDISLGWAWNPRLTGKKKTLNIILNDGTSLVCTHDHRILLRDGSWSEAQNLKKGFDLMPFYRISPNLTDRNSNKQFARIFTLDSGFKSERSVLDEFRIGKTPDSSMFNTVLRCIAAGLRTKDIARYVKKRWGTIDEMLQNHGLSYKQLRAFHERFPDRKKVLSISEGEEIDVYDLSVHEHKNFCTDSAIVHNCQKSENGHVFNIECSNSDVKEELNFLFFHPNMLNMDDQLFSLAKNLYIFGDQFLELVIDPDEPKAGVIKIQNLPPESIYRIETVKGRLIEFQQSAQGPDYEALSKVDILQATDLDLIQSNAIRFAPNQIVHMRIGDDRRTFYPYGVSLIEPARGPAHLLRLMEDASVVYRLTRSTQKLVFYIDVGTLPPFKAEMAMERVKSLLRKQKTFSSRGASAAGASPVEERFQPVSMEDDMFIPTRPNTNTRVEPLAAGSDFSALDDVKFFRDKLMIALNMPKNYFAQEDLNVTKVNVSSTSALVSNHVSRLQMNIARGLTQIAVRHLELKGYPPETYDDIKISLTDPYPVRKASLNDVTDAMFNRAVSILGSQLMSLYDIYIEILGFSETKAKELVARVQAQKLLDLRLQMMAQNPELMGVAAKPQQTEMGIDSSGPIPELPEETQEEPKEETQEENKPMLLPEPEFDDIKRFDLGIDDGSSGIDNEEFDVGEIGDEPI